MSGNYKTNTHLVWMDLEMTGLDPDSDTILEIATIVTDGSLDTVIEGPSLVVHHGQATLDRMDDWCKEHHGGSGLSERVLASAISMQNAEKQTMDFIQQYVGKKGSPLCGNSIHQDRRFLVRYMPELEGYLHYRNIDVSTIKELARRWYPDMPAWKKGGDHLAMNDVRKSIDELRYYRERVFIA